MNILGFDLGMHVGWAALHEGRLSSGAWENPHRYTDSPGRFFICFQTWLADMKQWHEPQLVAYEFTPHGGRTNGKLVHFGMVTRIQVWAYRIEAQTAFVYPNTLKKFTTGDGRAEKDAMIRAMRRRWAWRGTNDHTADALAVLAWAVEKEKAK